MLKYGVDIDRWKRNLWRFPECILIENKKYACEGWGKGESVGLWYYWLVCLINKNATCMKKYLMTAAAVATQVFDCLITNIA